MYKKKLNKNSKNNNNNQFVNNSIFDYYTNQQNNYNNTEEQSSYGMNVKTTGYIHEQFNGTDMIQTESELFNLEYNDRINKNIKNNKNKSK